MRASDEKALSKLAAGGSTVPSGSLPDLTLRYLSKRRRLSSATTGFQRDFLKMLTDWNREGLRCSDPIVGSYGKIGAAKGTYGLIDALDLLSDRNVPVAYRALWSAAPDRFAHAFNHLASKKRLRGRTIVLPPLPPWRVPAFIRSCSVITFLENNFPITFRGPQVPREVLACGTSLILSGEICSKVFFAAEIGGSDKCPAHRRPQ